MATTSHTAPLEGPWPRRAKTVDEWLSDHRVVVSATSASLISTFAGFPLDSLKSRLQSSRESISIPRLAAEVVKEEGIGGLWRGFPLPLITISIVRTISFTIYTSTKRLLNASSDVASASIPTRNSSKSKVHRVDHEMLEDPSQTPGAGPSSKPWAGDLRLNTFNRDTPSNVALTSLVAGGASGAVVCIGSAPFELVKVRRQLEYQIYRDSHPELFAPQPPPQPHTSQLPLHHSDPSHPAGTSASPPHHAPISVHPATPAKTPPFIPPTTLQAVRSIISQAGYRGLYTGWTLHFIRDTSGTALYFAEYDVMRWMLGRKRYTTARGKEADEQGEVPEWARAWLPKGLIPFLCGSIAGVTSWALIYPVDAIKTKAQQRALSGLSRRTPLEQLRRLVRGTNPDNPKPWLMGIARLYRGLGVSMVRSMLTHGLLWTIVDAAGSWIDTKPFERLAHSDPR